MYRSDNQKNKYDKGLLIAVTLFLIILASAIFFSDIAIYNTSFTNDEFQSVSVAQNLLEGNGFVRSTDLTAPQKYTRAWPAAILLAAWMKVFGISELSCKGLSAVYGILFVISAVYITYKLFCQFLPFLFYFKKKSSFIFSFQ